jgi:hypothetical protein
MAVLDRGGEENIQWQAGCKGFGDLGLDQAAAVRLGVDCLPGTERPATCPLGSLTSLAREGDAFAGAGPILSARWQAPKRGKPLRIHFVTTSGHMERC